MDNSTTLFKPRDSGPLILYAPSTGPATTPALTANLVCRVLFGFLANVVCLVPLRILHMNGEFAAVVFITNVEVKNLLTIVNALIWRNDHVEDWWAGYGFCDVNPYIHNFMIMLFVTCLLAIMRNVAQQTKLLRANPLTSKEKRRKRLVQSLIMFPLPLLQSALTWFLTGQRYAVGTLVGCTWVGYQTWVYLVFFIVPPLIAAIITTYYAVLAFFRYRQLAKTTVTALSSNRQANSRAQRTRRRLYFMVISILIPFLPMIICLATLNILDMPEILPYDYNAIHHHTDPYPWNTIIFLRSTDFDFAYMNTAWIPIVSSTVIFGFFGTTIDAINDYRKLLLACGLGNIFPKLREEYDPDKSVVGSSLGSSNATSQTPERISNKKFSHFASSFRVMSKTSSNVGTAQEHELHFMSEPRNADLESGQQAIVSHPDPVQRAPTPNTVNIPHRNPWLMRTNLNLPNFPFSLNFSRKNAHEISSPSQVSLRRFGSGSREPGAVNTRVWSNEERAQHTASASTATQDEDYNIDSRSIRSAEGVVVKTHLTRETHQAGDER